MSDFELVLMDGRPGPEWTGVIDDPDEYRIDYSGRYASSFKGSATVQAWGTRVTIENLIYNNRTNTTTFELVVGGYPGANHGLVFLNFTDTRRIPSAPLNSGITELKVYRPGYPLNTTKIFTDEYVALCKAADFACYRFYNVQNIWDGEPPYPAKTTWKNRKTPFDAAQTDMSALNGKRDEWCWEYIVKLSNILQKDIWICIHQSCDQDYVENLARYLKDSLDQSVNIYIESSNEVWSPAQATHGPYNQAEAQARGITFDQNHARRTVELSQWFANVFGQAEINHRVRVIMAGQHAYNGRSDNHLNYINTTFGPPKNYIYATSTALYFGSSSADSPDPATILAGMRTEIAAQINDPSVSTYRMNHIGKAASWNLPGGCTSYEGGPHLPAGGGTTNLDAQIQTHRLPGMADVLFANYLDGWKDIGGGLALHFTLASAYSRYGCWGLTDDYTNPHRNAKMGAAAVIASTATGIVRIERPTESGIGVSPNPATGYITLRSSGSQSARITDVLGRECWNGIVNGSAAVDATAWNRGIYFILSGGNAVTIVKQ